MPIATDARGIVARMRSELLANPGNSALGVSVNFSPAEGIKQKDKTKMDEESYTAYLCGSTSYVEANMIAPEVAALHILPEQLTLD